VKPLFSLFHCAAPRRQFLSGAAAPRKFGVMGHHDEAGNHQIVKPLYALAYKLGAWVSGVNCSVVNAKLSFPEIQWHDWMSKLWEWLAMLGEPILIGLPRAWRSPDILGCAWHGVWWWY